MNESKYTDLLWDFAFEGATRKPEVTLRVFASEPEMFVIRRRSTQTISIHLPPNLLGPSKTSRSEWTYSTLWEPGRELWRAIPPQAKDPLLKATPKRPCRLKISSNSPAIDDLPWEWLNDDSDPLFALRPEIRIVRSIPVRMAIPPMRVQVPVRVLLVITNPKDERLLDSWREIGAIRPRLDEPPYELRILEEPTWHALVEALREEPNIVHYVGHAGVERGEGNLILHDWNNMTHWIAGQELSRTLPLSVSLLCLSTCFTVPNYQILGLPRLAHIPAPYRLPTTVTNRYPVQESSVRLFWQVFYDSLAMHRGNVNEAFHEAQQAVATHPVADWGSFSLVIRDQSGEVMQLESGRTRSKENYATEIQAQLASRIANDLAERLLSFGLEPADTVERHYEKAARHASDLAERLE